MKICAEFSSAQIFYFSATQQWGSLWISATVWENYRLCRSAAQSRQRRARLPYPGLRFVYYLGL